MNNITKQVVVKNIVEKYEQELENAKIQTVLLNGYDRPGKIILKGAGDKGYIPDVVVKGPGTFELFEVEFGPGYKPDKWRLFSLYSSNQKGHFNIVIPEEQLTRLRSFLDKNKINARIFYFS